MHSIYVHVQYVCVCVAADLVEEVECSAQSEDEVHWLQVTVCEVGSHLGGGGGGGGGATIQTRVYMYMYTPRRS